MLLRFGFEQPTAYQLLYCVAPKDVNERRNEVIAPLTRSCFQRTLQAVEAAGQGRRARCARTCRLPRSMTEALIAACHGLVSIRLANPIAPWSEPERDDPRCCWTACSTVLRSAKCPDSDGQELLVSLPTFDDVLERRRPAGRRWR